MDDMDTPRLSLGRSKYRTLVSTSNGKIGRGWRRVNGSRGNQGAGGGKLVEMGELWPVPDVLAYLAGRWRTERTVRDLTSGAQGRFVGSTAFEALAGGGC